MPNPLGMRLKALPPSLDTIRMERLARQEELRKSKRTTGSPDEPKFPGYTRWLKNVSPEMSWDWPHLRLVRDYLAKGTRGELLKLAISWPPHGVTPSEWLCEVSIPSTSWCVPGPLEGVMAVM